MQMMVEAGDMRVMQVLADVTNTIAGGEVLQLMGSHDPDVDEERGCPCSAARRVPPSMTSTWCSQTLTAWSTRDSTSARPRRRWCSVD